MKTLGLSGGLLFLLVASAHSQQAPELPPVPSAAPTLTATNNLQRIFGPTAVYDGVLPEVKRRGGIVGRPDLRAPVVPGKEFQNISVNPSTGQAQGVVLFAVRF